jgi:hypothetical protein
MRPCARHRHFTRFSQHFAGPQTVAVRSAARVRAPGFPRLIARVHGQAMMLRRMKYPNRYTSNNQKHF